MTGPELNGDGGSVRRPGDEDAPGTKQTAENICPSCGGSGRLDGASCPECLGSGKITAIVGDA